MLPGYNLRVLPYFSQLTVILCTAVQLFGIVLLKLIKTVSKMYVIS